MTYRDDLQAARMRREALARELHQVRNRMDGYRELAQKEQALEREIAQSARDLDQARPRVELPLLSSVRVASPCKERWIDMSGDDHVRFCGRCEKNVYDLSALSASQAESLLRERGGESMCVSFFRRSDGTILTSDCPVGGRKRFWRRAATAAVASGLAAASITVSSMSGMLVKGNMGRMLETTPIEGRLVRGLMAMSTAPSDVKFRALDGRLEEVQFRLGMASTAEELEAIGSELESLSAEITSLQSRGAQASDRPEAADTCRKKPLDC